jgi:hypothetical protein
MPVEAFVAEASVEAFDEGVLSGLSGLDEVESHVAPIVGEEALRVAPNGRDCLEDTHYRGAWQGPRGFDGERLPRAIIDDVERAKAAPIGELNAGEVEAPALVGSYGCAWRQSRARDPFAQPPVQFKPF